MENKKMDKFLEEKQLEALKHDIEIFGAKEVWRIIESFDSPIARLLYRQRFFKILGEDYEI